MREQHLINLGGTLYEAVTGVPGKTVICAACDILGYCGRVACFPEDRDDGLWACWRRRITMTPAEMGEEAARAEKEKAV